MTTVTTEWREQTPGHQGWARTAQPGDTAKYFMVSADCHAREPSGWLKPRIDEKYWDRLPRVEVGDDGIRRILVEGLRPQKIGPVRDRPTRSDEERAARGAEPDKRLRDQERDGIDAEIVFANSGLHGFHTPDAEFSQAMCRAWNDWAHETYGPYRNRIIPMACINMADIDGAVAEIERVASLGFRGITIGTKPLFGPRQVQELDYNHRSFDRAWRAIEETRLAVTFHVASARDPRTSTGDGGAVINLVMHAEMPNMEPVVNLCASGVLERFSGLRFATIESGIGWVPWLLTAMDEAYLKHHMWVEPKLKELPSTYFRRHFCASFGEDQPGIDLADAYDIVDNIMWANDYPHPEGTWPYSAQAIERQMGALDDEQRAKILGLNAARFFHLDIPDWAYTGLDRNRLDSPGPT